LAKSIAAKLNVLESVIVRGEDSVEDARWGQAREVVRLLDAGHKGKDIAADWINGRTDEPYLPPHVTYCKQIWKRWGGLFSNNPAECPDWTTAYYTVQTHRAEIVPEDQRRQEWSEAHEARAPSNVDTAQRFVDNALAKSSPKVRAAIASGLLADPDTRHEVVTTPQGASSVIAAAQAARSHDPHPPQLDEPLPHVPSFGAVFWAAVRAVDVAVDHLDRYGIGDLLDPEASEAAGRLHRRAGEISAAVTESIIEQRLER
jgi:hypothetical protein